MDMEKIRICIADENEELRKQVAEVFVDERFDVSGVAKDGEELLMMSKLTRPDVIIMDILLSKKDGFAVIDELKKESHRSKIIILSSLSSEHFINKALTSGVEYYMIKPVDIKLVLERVEDLFKNFIIADNNEPKQDKNIKTKTKEITAFVNNKYFDEKITNIFITVGIPAHIKGYYFLREAIKLAIDEPQIINSITRELYPSIANKFDTSASKVERAIRHAIEVAWNRGKIENINSVFGLKVYSNNEKPTNGEFIALVADKMLLEG